MIISARTGCSNFVCFFICLQFAMLSQNEEELIVIESMFPEELSKPKDLTGFFELTLSDGNKYPIVMKWKYHSGYPMERPPYLELDIRWMDARQTSDLRDNMMRLFKKDSGVLLDWIEYLRQNVMSTVVWPTNKMENGQTSSIEKDEAVIDEKILDSISQTKKHESMASKKIGHQPKSVTVYHSEPLTDRKSIFQAHLAQVSSEEDVRIVFDQLKQNKKFALATHNISAYRLTIGGKLISFRDDDGEDKAGDKLLDLLELMKLEGFLIIVSRWYGGIKLGNDRFKNIVTVAKQLILSTINGVK